MAYLQECLERFENLPDDLRDRVGSLEAFEKIEKIEQSYGVDLKFLLVLIAIGEIDLEEVPAYLQSRNNLAEEDAYEIKEKIEEEFFYPYSNSSADSFLSREEVSSIFKDGLNRFLQEDESLRDEINLLNQSIFFHLSTDGLFQEELTRTLVDNNEKITDKSISIDGRPASPTISNWIKDFLRFHGAEIFDDLMLIQYLDRSDNVKLVSSSEKTVLRKLLKMYRNLNFFPESLENLPIEDWEMVPSPTEKLSARPLEDALSDSPDYQKNVIEEKLDMGASNSSNRLNELKTALINYPVSSLEYKALVQEINRLEKLEKNR